MPKSTSSLFVFIEDDTVVSPSSKLFVGSFLISLSVFCTAINASCIAIMLELASPPVKLYVLKFSMILTQADIPLELF